MRLVLSIVTMLLPLLDTSSEKTTVACVLPELAIARETIVGSVVFFVTVGELDELPVLRNESVRVTVRVSVPSASVCTSMGEIVCPADVIAMPDAVTVPLRWSVTV